MYEKNLENFRISSNIKPWTEWLDYPVKWEPKDDAMLLLGIHKYGYDLLLFIVIYLKLKK